jgi:FkbM family methyltransferase
VDLLKSNMLRNGLTDRITVRHAAVGVRVGEAFITDNGLSSTVVATPRKNSFPVPVVDFFAEAGSSPIDILKVDIEGSEYQLLKDERFSRLSVKTAVMEWHPTEEFPGESGGAWCRKALTNSGFTVEEYGGFRVLWAFRK